MFCLLLMDVSEPGGLIEDVGGVAKEVVSLLRFSEGLGTMLETTIWELQSTLFSLGPGLSFLRPCLSLKKVGKHKGTDWTRFAALHPFLDCMDLVSMQCTVVVMLTVEKQKDPSLVFLCSDKFSEILVKGVSTKNALTASLPPRSWSLEDILQ